ncbi:MAG: cupredoxin domain-containing protein [Chloroflexi bacterium]|nr:cupredoxin domain-containing protein [Chloroflexota bacterium]
MARGTLRPRRRRYQRRGAGGARSSPGLKGLAVFGAVVVVVLGAAAFFLWPAVKPAGGGTPGAITIQPTMAGFFPSQIEGRAGEPLTIRLVNKDTQFHTDGGGWHQFAIDELRVDEKIPPETTQEVTFTPGVAGTYQFYCDVCCGGRESPSMQGTLVVRA